MAHLLEQELVALVFRELPPGFGPADEAVWKAHLQSCSDCRLNLEDLRGAVDVLQWSPLEPPPPFGWARLQARIRRQEAAKAVPVDPAWIPVVFGHIAGIFLALALIALAGSALESASIWKSIGPWPICRDLGARGIAALVFFGSGSLLALALAPVLWWESRRSGRG